MSFVRTRWQQYVLTANGRAKRLGIEGRLTWGAAPEPGPCDYCGGPLETWDHVVPLSKGGANDLANLVPVCMGCNHWKNARSAESFRSEPRVYRLLCGWCWKPITRTRRVIRNAERIGVRTFVCSHSCGAHLAPPPALVENPNHHTAYMREWRARHRAKEALSL